MVHGDDDTSSSGGLLLLGCLFIGNVDDVLVRAWNDDEEERPIFDWGGR